MISRRKPDPPQGTFVTPLETKREKNARYKRESRARQKAALAGTSPLEVPQEKKPPLLPQGKKLSAAEAALLKSPFAESMEDYFKYMDQFLWAREEKAGKPTGQKPVWTDIDDEELAAFTRVAMRWGQKNAAVAATVRGVIELRDYADVGMVFVPRIQKTVEIIRETHVPRPPRARKEKSV